jgi:hypothetical protein
MPQPFGRVSLPAFIAVQAARLDGIADDAILAWLGLDAVDLRQASPCWSSYLAQQLVRPEFHLVFEELLESALSCWGRPIPPLDRDLEAWVAYRQLASRVEDPDAFARRLGLTAGDEIRLACMWRRRLKDRGLRTLARALTERPGLSLPKISVGRIFFPPPEHVTEEDPELLPPASRAARGAGARRATKRFDSAPRLPRGPR